MPKTNNRKLTLIRDGDNVTINVTYDAIFTVFERRLAGLGLKFFEFIDVIGVDPPGATTGTLLKNFPFTLLPVTDISQDDTGAQTISRNVSISVARTVLDEDSDPRLNPDVDADEIRCRIRLAAIGLPPGLTRDAFTNQDILGFVNQPTRSAEAQASD